jgi:pyruvate,water dikinase
MLPVSCAEGDTGNVYSGVLEVEIFSRVTNEMPHCPVKISMNVGNPNLAFEFQGLPNNGVGLARLEFVINNMIGIHPKAIIEYPKLPSELCSIIEKAARGYAGPKAFFVDKLAEGVGTIAAAFWPKPVIVRLSDFKSNEYRKLTGGMRYEPEEENPMLGFRGASRYISEMFRECFQMECAAMRKVREDFGLTNVQIMIPFVRTLEELKKVVDLLASNQLVRGQNDLRLIMMCELPSNALLADQFLEYVDGFSIGSNDLTQLTLGLDRDSALVANQFDERDEAVKILLRMAIQACRKAGKYVGICGQGPSDYPDFASWLVAEGIESISLNPDTVVDTWLLLAGQKHPPLELKGPDFSKRI